MENIREKLIGLLWEAWAYAEEVCGCTACSDCPAGQKNAKCMTTLAADHLIANGVTVQEWIPVSERLPEEGEGTVLVCGSRGGIYTAYLERSGKYPKWHKLNSKNHYCDPTHWMPLPQPPKGE